MEKGCGNEFPYYGASYPDARCIDGYLWDMDLAADIDGEQYLTNGGDEPCPFCNTDEKELRKIEQRSVYNIIEEEKPLLEKFKQAIYDCAWEKVTCKKEGETKEEYANRWAEHFLLMVRDWADDYIDYAIQQKLRKSYDKGKRRCNQNK